MRVHLSTNERYQLRRYRSVAYRAQGGLCYWCGEPMLSPVEGKGQSGDPRQCSADHLIPRSQGGQTTRENIVAAHRLCNGARRPDFKAGPAGNSPPPRQAGRVTLGDALPELAALLERMS